MLYRRIPLTVSRHIARCRVNGSGIWDVIPRIFDLDADHEYRPCPFRGEAYQWMRNLTLADTLASSRGTSGAVIAAYADSQGLATAKKVGLGSLGYPTLPGKKWIVPLSYQSIVALAQSNADNPADWKELSKWVTRKIEQVAPRTRT
jgi:hypothetical protein